MAHLILTCEAHPTLRWSTKEIAVNENGRYTGARNIFFMGEAKPGTNGTSYEDCNLMVKECPCKANMLIELDKFQNG